MDEEIVKHDPLENYNPLQTPTLQITARPYIGKICLKGPSENKDFLATAKAVLQTPLPLEPNHFVTFGGLTILWIGPDEWLVHCQEEWEEVLDYGLNAKLKRFSGAVINVSDYYVMLRIAGDKARALLQKSVPLDLYPPSFGPGRVAGTVLQKATITLAQVDATQFDIQMRRSFAAYVWHYLMDGAREFAETP